MINIFFKNRTLVLCKENENADFPADAVLIYDHGTSTLRNAIQTFDANENLPGMYILCRDVQATYRSLQTLFTEVEAAGGLVRSQTGAVLMIHRLGVWDLPKGKQETGEDARECAVREVQEECGTEVMEVGDLLCTTHHTYHRDGRFVLKHTHWYAMKADQDHRLTPQYEEDIEQAVWVYPDDVRLKAENTYPSIREVLASAGLI